MPIKKLSVIISIILSISYVGIGTIQIISIINGHSWIFSALGESFENAIWPAYFLGFAFGYGGGNMWVAIGQLITFGLFYFIFYFFSLFILTIIKKANKN